MFSFAPRMKLKDLALKFTSALSPIYDREEANALFHLVIAQHLKVNRTAYVLKKDVNVNLAEQEQVIRILNELKTGKPIQYILGEALFYGLPFEVNEAVLIPRPETEELVEWVLEKVKSGTWKALSILDIGTGSGCIAISIKKHLPLADISALDVSSKALDIAKQNAIKNNVDVSFFERDILKHPISLTPNRYKIIVSNPPYITQKEMAEMHENVLANEPHLALFVSNEKPLLFYEAIADFALKHLEDNGLLFFEINEYLGKEMVLMLAGKGFINIELRKDMQGKDRMICCVKTAGDIA